MGSGPEGCECRTELVCRYPRWCANFSTYTFYLLYVDCSVPAGIFIGVNAALISIVTEWLSDIKMGYCYDGWWLNQNFCCWEIDSNGDNPCESWHLWSTVSFARWIVYIIFAVMFSFVASHLVKEFATYAAGSGISEIKCILAGFVMKGYLGMWTLIIKSLTLVSPICIGTQRMNDACYLALGYCVRSVCRKGRSFSPCSMLHRIRGSASFQSLFTESK